MQAAAFVQLNEPEINVRTAGLRPEAGPRPYARGQLVLADRLAPRALLGLRRVLPHHRRRLDVGDLVAALRDD
jgi:hypothetical protein